MDIIIKREKGDKEIVEKRFIPITREKIFGVFIPLLEIFKPGWGNKSTCLKTGIR